MTKPIANLDGITIHRLAGMLLGLAAVACGEESTGPSPADVGGLYEGVIVTGAATCTPASAFDILEPTLGDRDLRIKLRVEDLGEQVRLTLLEIEGGTFTGDSSVVGALDRDGTVRLETRQRSDPITLGGRTFYDEAGGSTTGAFDRTAHPITFALTGTATQVFREGSASAPVFTTCTQPQSITGSQTSD
jgi:hypothetical protein